MSKVLQKIICSLIIMTISLGLTSVFGSSWDSEISNLTPPSSPEIYKDIINSLSDHINDVEILTDSDFVDNHDLLQEHMVALSEDEESITKSFELLDLFDEIIGGLFTTDNTRNGFNRDYTTDGLNLHRNIIQIHQWLIDYVYNSTWLTEDPTML